VEFSSRAAEAREPGSIWPLLVEELAEQAGVGGAAALEISALGGLRVAAEKNVALGPAPVEEEIGPELGAICGARVGHAFPEVATFTVVAGGDLLGAVVLFSNASLSPEAREIAGGLVDIAAIALAKAHQYADLTRSYAELRLSREVVARSEKLRLLGQMAASVSHDLKNIVNGLSLPLQLLRRELRGQPDKVSLIEGMEKTLSRGVATIDRLRDFSRQQPERPAEKAQLNPILSEAADLAAGRIKGTRIKLALELGDPPPIFVRSADLVSAVLNLIVNAVDALENKGTIVVRSAPCAGGARIEIQDDGPGMPPEVERRLFEPFFTTKGARGTGLGLAMVYAFVKRHRGTIGVETAPGAGTKFILTFPDWNETSPSPHVA
jgi:signal transduction histidine kinase